MLTLVEACSLLMEYTEVAIAVVHRVYEDMAIGAVSIELHTSFGTTL